MTSSWIYRLASLGVAATLCMAALPPAPSQAATPHAAVAMAAHTFNGTGEGRVWDGSIDQIRHMSRGTLSVTFSTSQTTGVGALFSASDRTVDSRNLTLAVSKGHLYWEVRDDKGTTYEAILDGEDAFVADGLTHTASIVVDDAMTSMYLDGVQVYSTTSQAFFNSLATITDARIGANVDNHGPQWQLIGTVESVSISATPADAAELSAEAPLPEARQIVDGTSAAVTDTAHQALASRTLTLDLSVPSSQGANAQLATLKRGSTAVMIASYRGNGLEIAMGGNKLSLPGTWSDRDRRITITVSDDSVIVFADGTYVGRGTLSSHSLGEVTTIESKVRMTLYSGVLPHAMIERLAGYSRHHELALFDRGYAGSASYRIPSLLYTKDGTLIAGADQRVASAYDSPNDINFVIRRSFDKGKTWQDVETIIDLPGEAKRAASTIDSVLLQNPDTGVITVVVDLFPGGIGQPNNAAGTGQNADGTLQLFTCSGERFALRTDGSVTTEDGKKTGWSARPNGDVYRDGAKVGNYYEPSRGTACNHEGLHILDTSYLVVTQSKDDGKTWSTPRFINSQVKEPWMKFLGTGPGTGIVIDSGQHKGRLVVPVYYSNTNNVYSSGVIYSDDDGITWNRGASPNDVRVVNGSTPGSEHLKGSALSLHEATVVQSGTDELTLFMRNLNPGRRIGVSRSTDGGATWSAPTFDPAVPEPFSQPNAISLGADHKTIIFANASSNRPYRGQGIIRVSRDGGRTWHKARTFNPGHYVYQAMTALPNGTIGLLWEREWQGLYFSSFTLDWLEASPVASIK